MAVPLLLRRLFDNDGLGEKLNKEIIPQLTIPYTATLYTENSIW